MLRSVEGKDYMTEQPVTFTPETNIFTAIHELIVNKVSGATVIDHDKKVIGVISEVDCLKAILDASYYGNANGTVGQFMSTDVECVSPQMDIIDVAQKLITSKRRRLPAVENGKFVGQFSIRSVLKAVKDFDVPPDPTERKSD